MAIMSNQAELEGEQYCHEKKGQINLPTTYHILVLVEC